MPRMARVVLPHYPHHVTQRGNRRQQTFFSDLDYQQYMLLIRQSMEVAHVRIWAYCLMPNHVHIVAVPEREDSLARLFRSAHLKYTRNINRREGWQGHLWQERFHSTIMDESHLIAAVRYVELNPVRANLVASAEGWPWSSARAHLARRDDILVEVAPMLSRANDWSAYLMEDAHSNYIDRIRECSRSGRPAGDEKFLASIEAITGRTMHKRKPGRKPKRHNTD